MDASSSSRLFSGKILKPTIFIQGPTNFFNGLRIPFLRNILGRKSDSIVGIRGCNMGYWKEDAFSINGYNEEIEGWGREDSEFIARLINNGVLKRNLRLGAVQFHIYHQEYDRTLLNKNDRVLNQTLEHNLTYCDQGINQKVLSAVAQG